MSHGSHDQHRAVYERVRAAANERGIPLAVFADLCGPKIRVGCFPGGSIQLEADAHVTVTTRDVLGGAGLVPSQYEALARDVKSGDRILLDDGNLELRVETVAGTEIDCVVVAGGILKDHKGMNLPNVAVSAPALTEKDRVDARFAIEIGVDFLALSFVRSADDVLQLRELIRAQGRNLPIIAKIEKPEALTNIDGILEASDAIMVARGDLGVELPPESVPNVQEELVDLARMRTKPVIVATQMLESMIAHPRPTRAEVTDVANAVRSGADAVMLSGETAAGEYPVEAVRMMDHVVRQTESYQFFHGAFGSIDAYTPTVRRPDPPLPIADAVAHATAVLSRDLLVRGIVVAPGGESLAVMSAARPAAPIVGAWTAAEPQPLGCLAWGVIPVLVEAEDAGTPEVAVRLAQHLALVEPGQTLLLVRGFEGDRARNRPSVTVVTV